VNNPAPQSLARRASSGAGWSFLDNATQQALSLIIFVILGRILSPALFGIVSTAMIFVFLMRSTVLNSVSVGLITLSDPVDEDYDTGFWLCIAIAGAAFALLNLLAGPIASFYKIPEFAGVIRATSIIVVLSGLSYAHIGWARRNFRFKQLAMRNTISTGVAGTVGIVVALAGYGLTALVLNQVIAGILALALLWRAIPWRPRARFSLERARAIMATALPLGLNSSLQFIAQNFDTAIITYLLGPFGGGLYAAAKRVVLAVQIALLQPMSAVTLPAFAEVAGDPVRLGNAAIRVSRLVMALTAPLFAGIALTAPVSVMVLFGPKWMGAAPIMTVLAGFALFAPSVGVLQQMVMALGRSKLILLTTLMQMALSLAAIALVGRPSPSVVAICLTGPVLAAFVVTLIVLTRITTFPLGRYGLAIGRPLVCTAIMAGAVLLVPDLRMGPLTQLVAMAVVGGAVYGAASLILAREAVAELSEFARTLKRKRSQKEQAA
jgi:O-antigen/teichoic acid export membrane protein